MSPEWYYDKEHSAFVAFADGESGCSRYDFSDDGLAIRKTPIRKPGGFAETYRADLKLMNRIGTLNTHLSIHDALKRGRLSDLVVAELRKYRSR